MKHEDMNDKYCLLRPTILSPPAKPDNCVVFSEKVNNTSKRPNANSIPRKPNKPFSIAVTKERILQVLLHCSFSYAVGIKTKLVNNVPPAADIDMTVAFFFFF